MIWPKIFSNTYQMNYWWCDPKIVSRRYHFINKSESLWHYNKLKESRAIIWVAVTRSNQVWGQVHLKVLKFEVLWQVHVPLLQQILLINSTATHQQPLLALPWCRVGKALLVNCHNSTRLLHRITLLYSSQLLGIMYQSALLPAKDNSLMFTCATTAMFVMEHNTTQWQNHFPYTLIEQSSL